MYRIATRLRPSRRRGFTLVELLVVMAVISILAALVMPALLRSLTAAKTANCIANLRQIGQGFTQYTSAWESWLICAGNNAEEHDRGGPIFEDAWITPWRYRADFPYWYEVLTDFVSPGLDKENLGAEYERLFNEPWPDFTGGALEESIGSDLGVGEELEEEGDISAVVNLNEAYGGKVKNVRYLRAKSAGIFTCPEMKESVIGYGYNYVAPFGNSSVYGAPHSDGGGGLVRHFRWKTQGGTEKDHPVKFAGAKRWIIPILWYGRSAHFGVLNTPSQQILICDTGFVVNAYKQISPNPDELHDDRHPSEWLERNDWTGQAYVRFPLNSATVNGDKYKLKRYRPMPRHGGRVSCLMFDGSSTAVSIEKIVGVQWGGQDCMYDNIPKTKPPVSPLANRAAMSMDGE